MKLLLIEDEPDFIARVKVASDNAGIEFIEASDVGIDSQFENTAAIEEQLVSRLRKIRDSQEFEIVLLDTDLSKMGNGLGQVACRAAFQELGIPVCRYTKRQSQTAISNLQFLRRLAIEGASAVWVPSDKVKGDLTESGLIAWLRGVSEGFNELKRSLVEKPDLLGHSRGPADILAHALGRPSVKADLLGYTAQNFFFFAAPEDTAAEKGSRTDIAQQATRLGYWLVNYILAFPGPILSKNAAAAYLNVSVESMSNPNVEALLKPARYTGPFHALDEYYWAEDLLGIIEQADGDIAKSKFLNNIKMERVDNENPESSAYLCILTNSPIKASDAASNPDWIPSGAKVARVTENLYDELGPLLSI
jgi:hypothetical protein